MIHRRRAARKAQRLGWGFTLTVGAILALCVGPRGPVISVSAQPPTLNRAGGDLSGTLRQRGDLSLKGVTLAQALFTISEQWNVNLVLGDEVDGRVNGVFRNAPLHEVLDSILLSNGYGYRVVGGSLVVMKLSALGDINPMFRSETISLRALQPKDVVDSAKLLNSPRGKVQAVDSAKSLLVVDFPDRLEMIRDFVKRLDQTAEKRLGGALPEGPQLQVAHYRPQFAEAESMKDSVAALLTKDGKVAVMKDQNELIVVDTTAALKMVTALVKRLDRPRPQVRITALIYDISLEDIERLGINWSNALKGGDDGNGNPDTLLSLDSVLTVPAQAGDLGGVMTFMNLSEHFDLTAVVQALQEAKDARLLANPNVVVQDRKEAKIEIVTEIPFQQLTQTGDGGQIGTTAFREAGVTLKVTPRIANDGTILMDVSPAFSRLAGFTTGGEAQPIIDRREAGTTVRIANRQTLVIGGLRQRSDVGNFNGIPGLKDIKKFHIGKLFRSREVTVSESELVVFIMPEIVYPGYMGLPREKRAYHVGNEMLERVPPAQIPPGPSMLHAPPPSNEVYGPYSHGGEEVPAEADESVIDPLPADRPPAPEPESPSDRGAARRPTSVRQAQRGRWPFYVNQRKMADNRRPSARTAKLERLPPVTRETPSIVSRNDVPPTAGRPRTATDALRGARSSNPPRNGRQQPARIEPVPIERAPATTEDERPTDRSSGIPWFSNLFGGSQRR